MTATTRTAARASPSKRLSFVRRPRPKSVRRSERPTREQRGEAKGADVALWRQWTDGSESLLDIKGGEERKETQHSEQQPDA